MSHVYAVMRAHKTNKSDYFYYSVQTDAGVVLGETCLYETKEDCQKNWDITKRMLQTILAEGNLSNGHRIAFVNDVYFYTITSANHSYRLRGHAHKNKKSAEAEWLKLLQYMNYPIYEYNHTERKERFTLPLDSKVIDYMYSLDGEGHLNIFNYTWELQWKDEKSWLWDSQEAQNCYYEYFHELDTLGGGKG